MNDSQLTYLSVLTSLNKMMADNHFSICAIDDAMKALGCVGDGAAYKILRPLHCVKWMDMPTELRGAVPKLIERCLAVPAHHFQLTPPEALSPEGLGRVQAGTLRLLTRGGTN